jgi:hypothetical protein
MSGYAADLSPDRKVFVDRQVAVLNLLGAWFAARAKRGKQSAPRSYARSRCLPDPLNACLGQRAVRWGQGVLMPKGNGLAGDRPSYPCLGLPRCHRVLIDLTDFELPAEDHRAAVVPALGVFRSW